MEINNYEEQKAQILKREYNNDDTVSQVNGVNQGSLIIKDNYITEQSNTKTKSMYNSRLFHVNENTHEPKLSEQLIGKNRQKSYGYNILVLVCFNINMAHFCFPYITSKCGILLTLIILIFCGFFSYCVQNSLVKYISDGRTADQCNYAAIIENNFGSFCATFLELSVLVWYGIMLLVCLITIKNLTYHLFNKPEYEIIVPLIYFFSVVIVFLLLNRINSTKMIDFDVFLCIGVHFISLIFYITEFIVYFIDSKGIGEVGDLFIFNDKEFYDSFNIFTGSLNTIIIFFWVNCKLSNSSVNKHTNMFKVSFIYMITYYILFILLKIFSVNSDGSKRQFILCPNFSDESFPKDGYLYYHTVSEIILNIINQVFMLNFYFLVIKSLILRNSVSFYFKRKSYFIWFTPFILLVGGLSFLSISPYTLLIINNGTVGFLINYMIPSFLFIKLSNDNFISFHIVSKIILVFVFSVLALTSFYKQILNSTFVINGM